MDSSLPSRLSRPRMENSMLSAMAAEREGSDAFPAQVGFGVVEFDQLEALAVEPLHQPIEGPVPEVFPRLEMLGGQAVLGIPVDGHGHEHPLPRPGDQF